MLSLVSLRRFSAIVRTETALESGHFVSTERRENKTKYGIKDKGEESGCRIECDGCEVRSNLHS